MTVMAQRRRSAAVHGLPPPNSIRTSSVPTFGELGGAANWNRLAASLFLHAAAILLLIRLVGLFPAATKIVSRNHESLILIAPSLDQPVTAKRLELPAPKMLAQLQVPQQRPSLVESPKIESPVLERAPEAPKIVASTGPLPEVLKPQVPQKKITEGLFDSRGSSTPTAESRLREVQTGGFGDPNGVPGKSFTEARLKVASTGSFDDFPGSGNGNLDAGSRHKRASVGSAGFSAEVAGSSSEQRNVTRAVSTAGFADASTAEVAGRRARTPDSTPVEILYKPKPVYTAEARQLHIEGEVLLDVMFNAAGDVRVLRVRRGLGHGLDEAAETAGQKIRFEPAKRDGRPYDSDAVVHIIFELAE